MFLLICLRCAGTALEFTVWRPSVALDGTSIYSREGRWMQALNGPWEQEAWRPRIDKPEGTAVVLSFLTSRGPFIAEVESLSD